MRTGSEAGRIQSLRSAFRGAVAIALGLLLLFVQDGPRDSSEPSPWSPDLVVDPGGPYHSHEGETVQLNASASFEGSARVEYRWDVGGDGTWESGWSSSGNLSYAFGDDYRGEACVEARAASPALPIYQVLGPYVWSVMVQRGALAAQAFVANHSRIAKLLVNAAINAQTPDAPLVVSLNESLYGGPLATWTVEPAGMPVRVPHWIELAAPDLELTVGKTYYLVFQTASHPGLYEVHASSDQYAGGSLFTKGGSRDWWSVSEADVMMELVAPEVVTSRACAPVTITNVAPSIESVKSSSQALVPAGVTIAIERQAHGAHGDVGSEGVNIRFSASADDPGSDDLSFRWSGECAGWADHLYPNDANRFPDPYPSPDIHPRNVTDIQTVICGDDGVFAWSLEVTDDDGGATVANGTFIVANLPPSLEVAPPEQLTVDEGTEVSLSATARDPGSDDLTFAWDWQFGPTDAHTHYNDGVGPDPPHSPNGIFPFAATDGSSFPYGDDGNYTVTLTVTDDDGGTLTCTTEIYVGNVPPTVEAGPSGSVDEGSPISFLFTFADPGYDQPAAGTWENFTASVDWGDGTSGSLTPFKVAGGPGVPTTGRVPASHVFADNGNYTVTVTVCDDDGGCGIDSLVIGVGNVPPTVDPVSNRTVDEGSELAIEFSFSDPGFDFPPAGTVEAFSATVTWGDTTSDRPSVDETPGSPGVPTTGTVNASHVYADDGRYRTDVIVCDDDGGCGSTPFFVTVNNVPPTVEAGPDRTADEGSFLSFAFSLTDPGFDFPGAGTWEDFTAKVTWGDGTMDILAVYEVPGSPGIPTTGTMSADHIYADNGLYTVTVTVCDDDGGCGSDTLDVTVANVPPTVEAGGDRTTDEGSFLSFTFSFADPGFDFPPAGTVEDFTAIVDWGYGPTEEAPVNETPGSSGVPTKGGVSVTHVYGDNGVFTVTVTVCDDDGGCGSDAMDVTVNNVPPVIDRVQAYVVANVTLRVAGEKWHDVRMDMVWNGNVTATARVVREPGSPDNQSATISGGRVQLLGDTRIILRYTPEDDPVNGQPNGANPAWVILTFPDGSEVGFHHTFNVLHSDTWTWTLDDFRPYLVGQEITFNATAHDVGSDDLTFTWSFGDGTPDTSTIHHNDGIGPDPYPSPEVNPITAVDTLTHSFGLTGTYSVTLTVWDDDGGSATTSFVLSLGT